MIQSHTFAEHQAHHIEIQQETYSKTVFGFWVYLMTDCILFATLFTTYAVLHNNTNGGATSQEIIHLPYVLIETMLLLVSSFTCGLGLLAMQNNQLKKTLSWLAVTFALGFGFLTMELVEFTQLVNEGNSWQESAFLSSYFTLVGTHGLHIACGLLWIIVMLLQVWNRGINYTTLRKVTCLSMFWHFLDVVWIFIFTFVYLLGAK